MEKEIETFREELSRLVEDAVCLYWDSVVKTSQELDKLIYKYYQSIVLT